MTKTLIILTISCLLFSCASQPVDENNIYYVIRHQTASAQDNSGDPPPPPPPTAYYGNYNFILLDSSTVYFHTQHIFRFCGTGIDNTKPPRIFLVPDNLTKLNIHDLPHFLEAIVKDSLLQNRRFFASIASPTDTIRNRAFKIIATSMHHKIPYAIRNWTEEEKYAMKAKIQNIKYNPDTVDWKVGFDTYFIPPKDKKEVE